MTLAFDSSHWALILGGSSGFGLATARKLARHGMNVAVVHRDRRGAMSAIEPEFQKLRDADVGFRSWNLDALAPEGRAKVLGELALEMGPHGRVRLLMHSIAYGNLKLLGPLASRDEERAERARQALAGQLGTTEPALAQALATLIEGESAGADLLATLAPPPAYDPDARLEDEDFARTVYSMGTSLASWAQEVFARGLFAPDARVVGMTSEGNEHAWRGYAAVSAAKVALESVSRSLALELGPFGVRSNVVQAGVTDTPALRLIPGSARMKAQARLRNPLGRLTTPDDVADVIALLCTDEAHWVNGALLRVDGGEHIAG
ncbi:MAG: SDR family oxidoreductase [Sorangiineae bacterium]|nr:SDR family oxidoreductase [Polyangiaceae bacterium]MEB2322073.1 SDR family oxidoreductase [Sorangiineae bacterium]